MNVGIDFINSEDKEDQTEFSIQAFDAEELSELFADFCKENKFQGDSVTCITVVQIASAIEDLD